MRIKSVVKGMLTFIPGISRVLPEPKTGGTDQAAYCYGVWLKHLVFLDANGYEEIPNKLAELGPGDSLGIGLCAMLSGTDIYYALDVIQFSDTDSNLEIFEELVDMFRARVGGPTGGWPSFEEYLDKNLFPSGILTEERLSKSLSAHRLESIRRAIKNLGVPQNGILISYMVPWSSPKVINESSVDAILSHSVLEHVVDLSEVYGAVHQWLRPGGVTSHQIDFGSHGLTQEWNGYWSCPEWLWLLTVGKREWLINRMPVSIHESFVGSSEWDVLCILKKYRDDGVDRGRLSKKWAELSEDDLTCSEVFLQAMKR